MTDARIIAPVYAQIALDIAKRIAQGTLKENTKVCGRSIMSSEYGVSPETVRRSMHLLSDMGIVEIKHNSGTIVRSAEKARRYIERFGDHQGIRSMQKNLTKLIEQQEQATCKISDVVVSVIRLSEHATEINPFTNHEEHVPVNSPLIGRTLADLRFWQQTGATVIAIRRGEMIVLSPGPYAMIQEKDILVYVSDISCTEIVSALVRGHEDVPIQQEYVILHHPVEGCTSP